MSTSAVSARDINHHFYAINERPVDDISLGFFYKPHTITLLAVSIFSVFYSAFTRDDTNLESNIWSGLRCVVLFFLTISLLTFPNGPFTRPHPAFWRLIFGISVLYLLGLIFILFQNYQTVKSMMYWFYPDLKNFHIDSEKQYAVNCSDLTLERIWDHMDVFALAHFLGWAMKALLIRHYGLCWTISVTWEITEVAFSHLLPNFAECWWDSWILDVLICNGLGIFCGMYVCHVLEMRTYKWESIKDIQSTSQKIRRAILQFSPESWTPIHWFDLNCTYIRFLAVTQLVIFWQLTELNTFFLKHIFETPPAHIINMGRLGLIALIVAPSVRQYYTYVTDTRCKRVGTQCWVFVAIVITETMICIKFGLNIFAHAQLWNLFIWLLIQFVLSIVCISLCVLWAKYHWNHVNNIVEEYWNKFEQKTIIIVLQKPNQYQFHCKFNSRLSLHNQEFDNNDKNDDSITSLLSENSKLDTIPKKVNALEIANTEDHLELLNEIGPTLKKSFNLAAYVNKSETLQQLVKLNVNLSKIEKISNELASFVVRCDFDNDIKPLLLLLLDNGVSINDVGHVLTKNPYLLTMHVDDLKTRINYFLFRKFSKKDIKEIFLKEPNVFNLKVQTIDKHLADLKQEYRLSPDLIRKVVRKHPKIILLDQIQIKKCTFMFQEELGFKTNEIQSIIVRHPYLWTKYYKESGHKNMLLSFEYVHNTMGIPHELILKFPMVITQRISLIRGRHLYLKFLKRNQYDPTKPLYVPLEAFFTMTDSEFCLKYCKTSVGDFNEFLKSL